MNVSSFRFAFWLPLMVAITWANSVVSHAGDAEAAPLRVGVTLALTGDREIYGLPQLEAIRRCILEINVAGGIDGRKVELLVRDNAGLSETVAKQVEEFAADATVLAVLTGETTASAMGAREPAARLGIPILCTGATADVVTTDHEWMFRCLFTDSFQGLAMARFLYEHKEITKVGLVYDSEITYSEGLAESFRKEFERLGGQVIDASVSTGTTIARYMEILTEMAASDVGAVFAPLYVEAAGQLVRAAARMDFKPILCGGDAWDNDSLFAGGGRRLAGSFFTTLHFNRDADERSRAFVRKTVEWGYANPDKDLVVGYDTATMLTVAMRGTKTRDEVRAGLAGLRDLALVGGNLVRMEDGNAIRSVGIVEIVAGESGNRADPPRIVIVPED